MPTQSLLFLIIPQREHLKILFYFNPKPHCHGHDTDTLGPEPVSAQKELVMHEGGRTMSALLKERRRQVPQAAVWLLDRQYLLSMSKRQHDREGLPRRKTCSQQRFSRAFQAATHLPTPVCSSPCV